MKSCWKQFAYKTDLCVVGGGLAGVIAAISAARHGLKVVLVQDRPVLGGNSSSEIRMGVRGARGFENKETGILSELELEQIWRNPQLNPSVWDSVLWGKVKAEPNITLLLNTSCLDVSMECGRIKEITCWQLTSYTWHIIQATHFADCSGDSVLSVPSGAFYRKGREDQSEYHESMERMEADTKTMGMSILIEARETNHAVSFVPPDWANQYDDETFATIAYDEHHSAHRDHCLDTDGCNFWWIEIGGDGDVNLETEKNRDALLKIAYGVWDHIKNHCKEQDASHWDLEWIGFLPGKRESRRYIGPYVLTQNDIQENRKFEDVVGYGGWPLDDHNPMGFLNQGDDTQKSQFLPTPSPYQIPFGVLYSKNIPNLWFAGRNISVTHAALSSTRVMGTCSVLGQAIGTAIAIAVKQHLDPKEFSKDEIAQLQATLLDDHCYLPGCIRKIPILNRKATINLPQEELSLLFDGVERPTSDGKEHRVFIEKGSSLSFQFKEKQFVTSLRVVFDEDFSRTSISHFKKVQLFAMRSHMGNDFQPACMPKHLAKDFSLEIDEGNGWRLLRRVEDNHRDLGKFAIGKEVMGVRLVMDQAWNDDRIGLYACDLQ